MKRLLLSLALLTFLNISASAECWMKNLIDNLYITQISIPGTHDAATGEGFSGFSAIGAGFSGKTQDLTISGQLDAGVRAFDLRPTQKGQKLPIYHGILETKASFDGALTTICDFVRKNPSEFAIVLMRHESDSSDDSSGATWKTLVTNCLNDAKYADVLVDYNPELTVGEMRGKVLVISRDQYANSPVGAFASGWNHDADISKQTNGTLRGAEASGRFYAQDFYDNTASGAVDTKIASIKALFDRSIARTGTDAQIMIINHASGYSSSLNSGITNVAAKTSAAIIDYLAGVKKAAGIVFMDFAGVDKTGSTTVNGLKLVNAIIDHNNTSGLMTSVENINTEQNNIRVNGNTICADGEIKVYSFDGSLIAHGIDEIKIENNGFYVVKASNGIQKIMIK